MEDGDGDRRWLSSLKPFKAGVRGRLGRRYRAPKGGAQGGRYKGEKVKVDSTPPVVFFDWHGHFSFNV